MRAVGEFCTKVAKFAGNPWSFVIAFILTLIWAIIGPFLNFSTGWQLSINTGTTIITFLMVFSIQHSQNEDNKRIEDKIDEIMNKLNDKK